MDNFSFVEALQQSLAGHLPAIVGAILLLLGGWLVALLVAAASRNILGRLGLNRRVGEVTGQSVDIELVLSRLLFWLVLVFALVAVFNSLNLLNVSTPFANMLNEVMVYLPRLFAGLVLALLGWTLAGLARAAITKLLDKTSLDEKLSAEAGMAPISASIGHVAYWLILLMFLPMVLNAWQLQGLLEPVQGMVDDMLAFLPNIVAATVIGVVGWLLARVVRGLVSNLLEATRLQAGLQDMGLNPDTHVPRMIGTVVFLLIFVPVLIAALDALQIEAISQPATQMLNQIMAAIPNVLAAALILIVTYYVARFAAQLLSSLLSGAGLDKLPAKIGLKKLLGTHRLTDLLGKLLVFFAMLFAVVEAANRLEFQQVSDIISTFILFGGDLLLGVVMLGIGFWLAGLAAEAIGRSQAGKAPWLADVVRWLIMGLVLAMGLRAMGLADSIVNLAFGLTLGAIAVAFALAFGLGGREAAGKLLNHWVSKQLDK